MFHSFYFGFFKWLFQGAGQESNRLMRSEMILPDKADIRAVAICCKRFAGRAAMLFSSSSWRDRWTLVCCSSVARMARDSFMLLISFCTSCNL